MGILLERQELERRRAKVVELLEKTFAQEEQVYKTYYADKEALRRKVNAGKLAVDKGGVLLLAIRDRRDEALEAVHTRHINERNALSGDERAIYRFEREKMLTALNERDLKNQQVEQLRIKQLEAQRKAKRSEKMRQRMLAEWEKLARRSAKVLVRDPADPWNADKFELIPDPQGFVGGRAPTRKQLAEHEMYGTLMWHVDYRKAPEEDRHNDMRDWVDPRTGCDGHNNKIKKPWMRLVGKKPNQRWEHIVPKTHKKAVKS